MWRLVQLLSAFFFSSLAVTFCEDTQNTSNGSIVRARLEVKAFIRDLLPYYHDVKIKYIPGKDPTMVFLNADNKVVMTEDVSEKSKEKICQLLETHGMLKSAEARSEVPEEPWEDEPEEPDEPWEEEEDRYEEDEPGDEEATEGPGTGEYGDDDDDDDDDDGPAHTEL